MALKKIELRPGIYKEGTKYSNQGGWYSCDKVRFRNGLPEKIGGWVQNNTNAFGTYNPFEGICRSLISWSDLTGQSYIGLGTSSKYYVLTGGTYVDITPIRRTVTLDPNPMSSLAGSNLLSINDVDSGANAGDWVTVSGVDEVSPGYAFGNIPIAKINTEFKVQSTVTSSTTLSAGAIEAFNGQPTLRITWTNHGLSSGNFITLNIGAAIAGIPEASIDGVRAVTVIDVNTFTVVAGANATSDGFSVGPCVANAYNVIVALDVDPTTITTAVGGGSTVQLEYQISAGLNTVVSGTGWGAGPWSRGGWGSSYISPNPTSTALRLWSQDNYGQDLVICVRDGAIYYESQASIATATRAVNITSLSGADACPIIAREICVTGARNVLAFGCNAYLETDQNPMLIRWSASENIADWHVRSDNDAGDILLSSGSKIITQIQTKQEVIVWTDIAVFSVKYVGSPFFYGSDQVGYGTSIIGPNAKIAVDDTVYWMGNSAFYVYNGRMEQIPCSVKDYIFSDINQGQGEKVYCGSNVSIGEVWWFYPSSNATENDRYVTYNYNDKVWFVGTMARSAWLDFAVNGLPIATTPYAFGEDQSLLLNHEVGTDDGEFIPSQPMQAYITSSPFEIGDGDSMMFVRQVYPDITFRGSNASNDIPPTVLFDIKGYNYPGEAVSQTDDTEIVNTGYPVDVFTPQISLRLRARSVTMSIYSGASGQVGLGVAWRLGIPRLEMRTDGRR